MVQYYEARVIFDYNPGASDELRLRKGESVEIRIGPDVVCEEGWLSGSDLRGSHGIFPANHVVDVAKGQTSAAASDLYSSDTGRPQEQLLPKQGNEHQSYGTDCVTESAVGGKPTTPIAARCRVVPDRPKANNGPYSASTAVAAVLRSTTPTTSSTTIAAAGAVDGPASILAPQSRQKRCREYNDGLPEGWHSAQDKSTGAVYYYTEDGQSSWVKPTAVESAGDPASAAAATLCHTVEDRAGQRSVDVGGNEGRQNYGDGNSMAESSSCSNMEAHRAQLAQAEWAAIRIQAVARGKLDRRQFAEMREKQRRAEQEASSQDSRASVCYTRYQSAPVNSGWKNSASCPALAGSIAQTEERGGSSALTTTPESVKLDRSMVRLIAALVDDRLMEELHRRDAVLAEIQNKVANLMVNQRQVPEKGPSPNDRHTGSPTRSPRAHMSPTQQVISNNVRGSGKPTRGSNPLSDLSERATRQRHVSPGHYESRRVHDRHPVDDRSGDGPGLPGSECSISPTSQARKLNKLTQPTGISVPKTNNSGGGRGVRPMTSRSVGFTFPVDDADASSGKNRRGGHFGGVAVRVGKGRGVSPPRVADIEGINRIRLAKQKAKAAEPAAVAKRSPDGRSVVYYPSWYDPAQANTSAPDSKLELEYIHGYAGETPAGCGGIAGTGGGQAGRVSGTRQAATRSTNIFWLRTGEVVFPASAVVVLHDFETNRQRFFTGHDEEVTALAVHPHKDVAASGQAGKKAIVCIFDASRHAEPVKRGASASSTAGGAGQPPLVLRELSLGKKETRGVVALDFSADGNLLLAMAVGESQALSVWDWRRGIGLVTARAETAFLCAYSVRFNPCLYLAGKQAEAAGLSPGEACYTIVSCGQRHVKFWTLTRAWYPRIGDQNACGHSGDSVIREDSGAGVGGGWAWSLNSKPGNFGSRGEMEDMTCMAFIGEPRLGEAAVAAAEAVASAAKAATRRLPTARAVTGTENGQIYFWEVLEEYPQPIPGDTHADSIQMTKQLATSATAAGWKPRGRLLATVPKAHDGPITDMCYLPRDSHGSSDATLENTETTVSPERATRASSSEWGKLATCGADGTLRLWAVAGDGPSPLELLLTVDISTRGVGIGHARSVSWDRSGTTLALGTVGNAVCLVQPGGEDFQRVGRRGPGSVMFMLAVQGHTGLCKALASHPSRPWFVTGGTDRMLRLWDARSRRQLSAARLLERISSVAFHPAGHVLAVGGEAGDFLLIVLRSPMSDAMGKDGGGNNDMADKNKRAAFSWDVLARKRIAPARGASSRDPTPNDLSGGPGERKQGNVKHSSGGIGRGGGGSLIGLRPANRGRQPRKMTGGAGGAYGHEADRNRYYPDARRRTDDSSSSFSPPSRQKDKSPRQRETARVGGSAASAAMEVGVLRFSPDGEVLAAACGSCINLYLEDYGDSGGGGGGGAGGGGAGQGAYRRYGVCTGHSTTVKSFDFSKDGSVLQSNDFSKELLFWEVSTGRQISDGSKLRDVAMASWTCPVGWPTQGLTKAFAAHSRGRSLVAAGIAAVCRSNAGDVLAVSDDDNCVSLARSPAPEGAATLANWGHSTACGISTLTFLCDDRRLVSTGGTCAFVWR